MTTFYFHGSAYRVLVAGPADVALDLAQVLARDGHLVRVHRNRSGGVMIISQGDDYDNSVLPDAFKGELFSHVATAPSPDTMSCDGCRRRDSCRGPASVVPRPDTSSMQEFQALAETAMASQCPRLVVSECPLALPRTTVTRSVLRGLGVDFDTKITMFTGGTGWHQKNAGIDGMSFDDDAVSGRREAHARSMDESREFQSGRGVFEKNCELCLLSGSCGRHKDIGRRVVEQAPVTRGEVLTNFPADGIDRQWVERFFYMGAKFAYRAPGHGGRGRQVIGNRPTKHGQVLITSLVPPFEGVDIISWPVYRDLSGVDTTWASGHVARWSNEELSTCTWMLMTIVDAVSRGECRFDIGTERSVRNDILTVYLSQGDYITIGSDTRASRYGGFLSRGGDRIGICDRPRFETAYPLSDPSSLNQIVGGVSGTCINDRWTWRRLHEQEDRCL